MKIDLLKFILALIAVVFSFAWFTLLAFVEVPIPNRELISAFSGFLLGTGLSQIYNYFFGSSLGSDKKTDMLNSVGK